MVFGGGFELASLVFADDGFLGVDFALGFSAEEVDAVPLRVVFAVVVVFVDVFVVEDFAAGGLDVEALLLLRCAGLVALADLGLLVDGLVLAVFDVPEDVLAVVFLDRVVLGFDAVTRSSNEACFGEEFSEDVLLRDRVFFSVGAASDSQMAVIAMTSSSERSSTTCLPVVAARVCRGASSRRIILGASLLKCSVIRVLSFPVAVPASWAVRGSFQASTPWPYLPCTGNCSTATRLALPSDVAKRT